MNNTTKNIAIVILCVIIVGALGLSFYRIAVGDISDEPNPNVTLVTAPEQSDFELHPEWGGPQLSYTDYGENLALGKLVTQNGNTDIYHCSNVTDGNVQTYWEGLSGLLPNEVTIDMDVITEMAAVQILLNPDPVWGTRVQEIEIQVSTDGESYTTVYDKAPLSFDTADTNSVYIPFTETVNGQYVKVLFHSNTGAGGGQAAEIEVYAP